MFDIFFLCYYVLIFHLKSFVFMMTKLFFVALYHLITLEIINSSSCYKNTFYHLGTKTAYRIIENKATGTISYEGCEPKKIWMIIRHGTRLPSRVFINKMKTRLSVLREKILQNYKTNSQKLDYFEIENLRNWANTIHENDEKILAHEGEDEMINLAERMQLRLPNNFPTIYNNHSYTFRYTATQRTQQSAHYFATGLFGKNIASSVWYPPALYKDPILRFYKLCAKWKKEIKKNPAALKERDLFINNSISKKILKSVNAKLGFKDELTWGDLHLMYTTCAFESSWSKQRMSPWCAVFTEEAIKALEYAEDLKYYWIDGPGYNLTYRQACPVIQNLVEYFKNPSEHPKAVLYFTHSGTILKLLAHLRLYIDNEQLKHDNFDKHFQRKWKVSKIDSFGSNIAAVLFRCEDNTDKILFLHQERVVKIPGCSELCNFSTFLNIFHESVNNCNFEEMCHL